MGMLQDCAEKGVAKCVPMVCQGCAKDVPRVCQGCAKGVPRVCQGCAKGVPRVCQGCANGVPWRDDGAPWCAKGVLVECAAKGVP